MGRPELNYIAVIKAIPNLDENFAIHEIEAITKMSTSSIRRILVVLEGLKLLYRRKSAFNHKTWSRTRRWVSVEETITDYEWLKMFYNIGEINKRLIKESRR